LIAFSASHPAAGVGGDWWRGSVFYEIFPRSFVDSDGDGIGDIRGLIARLPYLVELGIDAIWLCPFYPSSFMDGGYDVDDYESVAPVMGTIWDFDAFISEAHGLGFRVVVDLVANHTSSRHPWFVDSASSRRSPRRNWYIWTSAPNDWIAALNSGSAWSLDPTTDQYYLHLFLPQQPDLNWREPGVRAAFHSVMRTWLSRGVDGFRVDAAHCLGKDVELRSRPELGNAPIASVNDEAFTHAVLRGMRKVVEEFGKDKLLLGEIFLDGIERVLPYYGEENDELHLAFDFSLLRAEWDCSVFAKTIRAVETAYGARGAWPTWVLGNHDRPRLASKYGSLNRARAAAVILLTLRGTPFIYAGDELGLQSSVVRDEYAVDPNGRDGYRNPMPWESTVDFGWPGARPRVPFAPNSRENAADRQIHDKDSVFALYRSLIALRRSEPALIYGTTEVMSGTPEEVLGYARVLNGDRFEIYVNFGPIATPLPSLSSGKVVLASSSKAVEAGGRLASSAAVILSPNS
jgi:alpha-glucosidase